MTYLFHSLAGMGALLAACIMVGVSVYSLRSHEANEKAQWWTSLILATGYALLSTGFYCRSFEAHHETFRTSVITWTGIGTLVIGFLCSRRIWKRSSRKKNAV